jgi:hypothetical protein
MESGTPPGEGGFGAPPPYTPPPTAYGPPPPPPGGGQDLVKRLTVPVYQSRAWLYLLGICSVLSGLLAALTIFGIVVAWLPIWMGVLLMQAASAAERAQLTGNEPELRQALDKLKVYFVINGITTLLGLLFGVLAFFLGMFGMFAEYLDY